MKDMMVNQIVFDRKLYTKRYSNGQLEVHVQENDGEPIAELSIMNDFTELAPDEFILKDYSENAKISKELLELDEIVTTDRFVLIGSHLCPICQLKSEV